MDRQDTQNLADLIDALRSMAEPERRTLADLARQSAERYRRMSAQVEHLQRVLDSLRLGVKYTLFDLEATRRENADLRRRLGDGETNQR
jgi:hypothetical protein